MIGQNTLKRVIVRAAGRAALLAGPFSSRLPHPRACIFYYHRVADVGFVDPHLDDWNVPPHVFEQQIAMLAESAEIVPLFELAERLKGSSSSSRPLVCLTFDDGYANFYTRALPVLKRYRAPATLFVVTSLIGDAEPVPFDRWSLRNRNRVSPEAWRPINWTELEDCLESGLVSIGAHSHSHFKGGECTRSQLAEEAERSREILFCRFGQSQAWAYAYPYGSTKQGNASPEYARAVRAAGYQMAVTTDLGLASSDCNPYFLPRIEAHALDTPAILRAKAEGALAPYYLADCLRMAKRSNEFPRKDSRPRRAY